MNDTCLNLELLRADISAWQVKKKENAERALQYSVGRDDRASYYSSANAEIVRAMNIKMLSAYISKLNAMRVWRNRDYAINKIMEENGFDELKEEISELVWSNAAIEGRWDRFISNVTGIGPAMMSELLCYSRPTDYMLWHRHAYLRLRNLGVNDLPRYSYQVTGQRYQRLCKISQNIAVIMRSLGVNEPDMVTVDRFICDEV